MKTRLFAASFTLLVAVATALLPAVSPVHAENAPLRIGFSFNEGQAPGGGPVTDYYGSRDGTFVGTWGVGGDASYYFTDGASGEPDDHAVFFGGNRVTVDLAAALSGAWESFTFEVRLQVSPETSAWSRALHMFGGPSLIQRQSNLDSLRVGGTVENIDISVPTDEWFHVAWVHEADTGIVTVYLNGEEAGSGLLNPSMLTPGMLVIGATDHGGSFWATPLDDFRFTHTALAPEEFLLEGFGADLIDPETPLPEPSIQVGYSFNEGAAVAGQALTDYYRRQNGIYFGEWMVNDDPAHHFRDGFSGALGDHSVVFTGNRATVDLGEALGGAWESFTFELNLFMTAETAAWSRALHVLGGPSLIQRQSNQNAIRIGGTEVGIDVAVPLNQWFHLAWVYNADTGMVTVYVDGEALGSGTLDPLLLTPGTLVIGATDSGGSPWGTPLDDFRFSDAALLPEQFVREGFGAELTDPASGLTYDEWRVLHFSLEELNDPSFSGPDSDPAGDGISNLMKFALGLGDPKTPARDALPQADLADGALEMTYTRLKDAAGVDLRAEFSEDLIVWESGAEVLQIVDTLDDEDVERITVRAAAPGAEMERAFLRLRAIQTVE